MSIGVGQLSRKYYTPVQREELAAGAAAEQAVAGKAPRGKMATALLEGLAELTRLPANHVNEVLAVNFSVMQVRSLCSQNCLHKVGKPGAVKIASIKWVSQVQAKLPAQSG